MLQDSNEPRESHRADSLALYKGIIASKTSTHKEKLAARERIDKLLGLESPSKLDVTSGGKMVKALVGVNPEDI